MIKYKLEPKDCTITYKGKGIDFRNLTKNPFTGVWTFDLHYPDGVLLGVPISAGTNVIKGNGTPFYMVVFLDEDSLDGDITSPKSTNLYIVEE